LLLLVLKLNLVVVVGRIFGFVSGVCETAGGSIVTGLSYFLYPVIFGFEALNDI
jgi:hypothetical protein